MPSEDRCGSKPVVLWSSTRIQLCPQNPTSARLMSTGPSEDVRTLAKEFGCSMKQISNVRRGIHVRPNSGGSQYGVLAKVPVLLAMHRWLPWSHRGAIRRVNLRAVPTGGGLQKIHCPVTRIDWVMAAAKRRVRIAPEDPHYDTLLLVGVL